MEQTTSKRKFNISFLIMVFSILCYTVVQFIPIYFVDTGFRMLFYFVLYILLIITISRTVFEKFYKPEKKSSSSALIYSLLIGIATFVVFGLWTFGLFFSVWTEASTLFIRKNNPNIKIITRYVNQGAFGGGTEQNDYQIVLHRPFLFFFKMETSIDSTKLDKSKWIKSED